MPGTIDEWPNWCLALPVPLEEIEQSELAAAIARRPERPVALCFVSREPGMSVADLPSPRPWRPCWPSWPASCRAGTTSTSQSGTASAASCSATVNEVELGSRNELPLTRYFPEVVQALQRCVAAAGSAGRRGGGGRAGGTGFRRALSNGCTRRRAGCGCWRKRRPPPLSPSTCWRSATATCARAVPRTPASPGRAR